VRQEEKVYAALSYVWILVFVPLLVKRQSGFVQFHVRQGLVLLIAELILWVVGMVPVLGWLIAFVGHIVVTVLAVLGIVAALVGRYWEMPFFSEYAKKLNI
jgi:uncharacterized membrane protein